jgi:hypothetical protein
MSPPLPRAAAAAAAQPGFTSSAGLLAALHLARTLAEAERIAASLSA